MVKRLYVMLCLVCLHLAAWAEVVTGTIRDAETGEVLVDATVLEEASQKGSEFGNKSEALTGRAGGEAVGQRLFSTTPSADDDEIEQVIRSYKPGRNISLTLTYKMDK
ncbi:MAG: hypothetical protein Q4D23_09005 [Bacteroidales bacterium]|nr:hypothetical protein [Bacteroidales bacterium]